MAGMTLHKALFPALYRERHWGTMRARFEAAVPDDDDRVAEVCVVPFTREGHTIVVDDGFGVPGSTPDPNEDWRDTAERALREQVGARLVTFEVLGVVRDETAGGTVALIGWAEVELDAGSLDDVVMPGDAARRLRLSGRAHLADLYELATLLRARYPAITA